METNTVKTDLKSRLVLGFDDFKKNLNGYSSSEYNKVRNDALNRFDTLGFPTKHFEEYRYTNIYPVTTKDFEISYKQDIGEKTLGKYLIKGFESNLLVLVNGHYNESLSKILSPSDEIEISDIRDAIKNESINNNFLKIADYSNDPFIALNTAYFTGGIYINIKGDVKLPVMILNLCGDKDKEVLSQPRIFITANENTHADIIEKSETLCDNYVFSNTVTEIFSGKNSVLTHLRIQNDGTKAYTLSHTSVEQEESSVYDSYAASWGGSILRNNLTAYLNGKHSECILRGLYYIDGKSLIDNHTTVEHKVPECHSNELYKGIITDNGWGVFNGKIIVDKDAQKTNAYQSNKNILLSDTATINAKPQLEIYADDVKCSHGATTGQIDPEELFYLRSRGISLDTAKKMLQFAFLDGILTEYKDEKVRDYLEKILHKKLSNEKTI